MDIDKNHSAIITVDVQNDFCDGGALAVKNGNAVIPVINKLVKYFDYAVATQDWHPEAHISFASSHKNKKPYDMLTLNGIDSPLWPSHCVQGSFGADFHKNLDTNPYRLIIRKGFRPELDSYSAFFENDGKTKTGLDGWLKTLGINVLFIVGLALDYCVYYSAVDAAKLGFSVFVIEDACMPVASPADSVKNAKLDMASHGIALIQASDIMHENI